MSDLAGSDPLVVVVGAGAAGMSAAISAARAGADVCLVDANRLPGGTVTHALIHTLGGIYDESCRFLNDGIVRELTRRLERASPSVTPRRIGKTWTLSVCPDIYSGVVKAWLEDEPRLTVLQGTRIEGVTVESASVLEVEAVEGDRSLHLRAGAVIDTTGTGEVIRLIDPDLIIDDDERAAGGLIFRVRGIEPGALDFPKGVKFTLALRRAAEQGELPAACRNAWIDRGAYEDEVYVKLFVPLLQDWRERERRGEVTRDALKVQASVMSLLYRFQEFARAELWSTGQLGVRDGGRIKGEYWLTAADVREARKFPDAACRCCWPIEYWHPQRGVTMEYLPSGSHYEIPLRSLKVKGLANVWAAGKCLSADRLAQASARVVGSCWTMGEACGVAAAAQEGAFRWR